jgi:hypothetical protein
MAGRRGRHIGWSNSLGCYEGFCLLVSVNPQGVISGLGFAPASTKDQPLAQTFFALRCETHPRLGSVGSAALGPYVADKGFEGAERTIKGGSRSLRGTYRLPTQTQRTQEEMAQATEALGGVHRPDRRERL